MASLPLLDITSCSTGSIPHSQQALLGEFHLHSGLSKDVQLQTCLCGTGKYLLHSCQQQGKELQQNNDGQRWGNNNLNTSAARLVEYHLSNSKK